MGDSCSWFLCTWCCWSHGLSLLVMGLSALIPTMISFYIMVPDLCSSLVFVFSQSWPVLGTRSMTTGKARVQRHSRWLPRMGKPSWNGRHQQPEEQIATQFWFSLSLIFTFTFKNTDMALTPHDLLFVYKLSQTLVSNNFPAFNKTSLIMCWILSVQSPRCPQTLMGRNFLQQFGSHETGLNLQTANLSTCHGCWRRFTLTQLAPGRC